MPPPRGGGTVGKGSFERSGWRGRGVRSFFLQEGYGPDTILVTRSEKSLFHSKLKEEMGGRVGPSCFKRGIGH